MKIGFIGLGVMGAPMAGHLHRVFGLVGIHTRTRSKADPLLSQGVAWFETPQALAQQCDVVCTMLGFPPDVHAVYFGPEAFLQAPIVGCVVSISQPPGLNSPKILPAN